MTTPHLPPPPSPLGWLSLALALSLWAWPGGSRAAGEFKAHGFSLPAGSVRVDDDRYRLPMTWDDTMRFLRNTYVAAKYPRRALANQSGVRAIHLDNPKAGEEWEGVNVYEVGKGEVRIFILVRAPAK
jgi:hypothetical protein